MRVVALVLVVACARPTTTPAGIEAGDVDRRVDPCTDFYAYANGAWRAHNPIPTGKTKWSRREAARDANKQKVRALVEELAAKPNRPAGSPEQLVGDFYASCMDEAAVEAAGIAPIAPVLADLDAVTTPADVQRAVRRLHELGIAAPFGETGAYANREPSEFQLDLVAGGLGLPDRDAYAKPELRERYRRRVARVLALAGMPEPDTLAAADGVIALETRLADASLDAKTAADSAATEHAMTLAQLAELAPHVEWAAYLDEARIPRGTINVAEPAFIQAVDREFATTPVAAWRTYLKWQLVAAAAPWLAKAFADEGAELAPRAQRCVELTESLLGEPLGRTYADRYFTPAAKAKARAIANGLVAVLKEDVAGLPWMTAATKQTAIAKLETMSIQIGYPDHWKDYSSVQVRRDALWANIARARRFAVDDGRRQMGKPSDRDNWQLPPSSPAAYLDAQLDELVLPAGFLQPPYFDAGATDAVNYGAFGAGLAHDMTHAFDATGALLDAKGRAQPWWTDADRQAFAQRAACIVDQYEHYEVEPGLHHEGKRVLDEALGDQAGVHFAYLALERSMATHPVPTVGGFTPAQQFFLAWGQFLGEAVSLEAQRQLVKGDPHPVPRLRVIGPLANSPEFARAFSCGSGAPMVRPPEQRCAVW